MLSIVLAIFVFFSTYSQPSSFYLFFFNDTATTEIYTLSLHDALPISNPISHHRIEIWQSPGRQLRIRRLFDDNRSEEHTSELQSGYISYAVFCLKKKNKCT